MPEDDAMLKNDKLHMQKFAEISFGGIPNSNSIDILMPCAIFDYMGAVLPMWTMLSP